MSQYETIIGLEVHVQLATKSKLFCGCPNRFGGEPNTQVCPVCLGMPGSLPVLNEKAIEFALLTGVALECVTPTTEQVNFTKWDRKQYFYPDLPKGYQTSQFDLPITETGKLKITVEDAHNGETVRDIRITRAHLEEDAGKSSHDESGGGGDSIIDLNRSGTPLLEIVSEPDLRSSAEAKAYLTELKLLLTFLGVSDCNMQEGSLRVDANVNLHVDDPAEPGKKAATPIVEVKNLNSFRSVERAIDYEVSRQWKDWQETGRRMGQAPKTTRGWDDSAEVTRPQREKEDSADYRYFPCPDLAPVVTPAAEIEAIHTAMPELPAATRSRLQAEHRVSKKDAAWIVSQSVLTDHEAIQREKKKPNYAEIRPNYETTYPIFPGRALVDYFEQVANESENSKQAYNWFSQHLLPKLREADHPYAEKLLSSSSLSHLIRKVDAGDLPSSRSREVFELMIEKSIDADAAMDGLGITAVDESELVAICQELLNSNPKVVADVQGGKQQAVGSLIGQAKKRNPNADPGRVRAICLELIAAM